MESFSKRVLGWYQNHARTLPWRVGPVDGANGVVPDPYHVWLSEVMLQQTTVATVKSYFEKFTSQWHTVDDLAASDSDDIMKAWAGLGYYSRARNLKACADIIAQEFGGQFPSTKEELIKLPGIGDYTSSAIAAIAFGERVPVVDGNIERVTTRYLANQTPLPTVKSVCRQFMDDVTPAARPGDFAQAMMDLGATVCTPKSPMCGFCPVNDDCLAHQQGRMLEFPVKPAKKAKPVRMGAAYVAQNAGGDIWLVSRPKKGLLGGMSGVPTTNWTASNDGATGLAQCPAEGDWERVDNVRHTFTHFHLELEVWHARIRQPAGAGWWSSRENLPTEALPTLMKKVITAVLPDAFREPPQ